MEAENAALRATIESLKTECKKADDNTTAIKRYSEKKEKEISTLESKAEALEKELKDRKQKIDTAKSKISELIAEVDVSDEDALKAGLDEIRKVLHDGRRKLQKK